MMLNDENSIDGNVCRACLRNNMKMESIFDTKQDDVDLEVMIMAITSVQLNKEDGMPHKMCKKCIGAVLRAYKFRRQFEESHTKLCEMIEKRNKRNDREVDHGFDQKSTHVEIESTVEDVDTKASVDNVDRSNDDDDDCKMSEYSSEDDEPISAMITRTKSERNGSPAAESTARRVPKNVYGRELCDKKSIAKKSSQQREGSSHECDTCGKQFTAATHLKFHKRCHLKDDEKRYKCDVCGNQYAYAYQLTQHAYKHSENKPYPCTHCDKGCLTAESLRRHLRTHEKTDTKPTYACTVCKKEFRYRSFLAEHMKNHTGERPFLCSLCGKGFRQHGALKCHTQSHSNTKSFECGICKGSYKSQSVLKIHMRKHTGERPYVCDLCGRAFRQSTDMRRHQRTHTGELPVQCSVCGKCMATTGQLNVHMRSHTGEKPYECKICGRPFSTKTICVKHLRIHTGERPYKCYVCERTFSQSSTLKTHMKIHDRNGSTRDGVGERTIGDGRHSNAVGSSENRDSKEADDEKQ